MKLSILVSSLGMVFSSAVVAAPMAITDGKASFVAKAVPGFLSIDSTDAPVSGELDKNGKALTGELRCKMDAFTISIDFRNKEMREKYLKVANFPESVLKLTSFELDDKGLADNKPFKGTLKVRDVEKPVEGTATVEKKGDGHYVVANMVVNTETFGLGVPSHAGVKLVKDVPVKVEFAMKEKAAGAVAGTPTSTPAATPTASAPAATPTPASTGAGKGTTGAGKAAPAEVKKK